VALTEADWLTCDKVTIDVLNWLHRRYRGRDRKFRLAGAAAARHVAHQLTGPRYRNLIDLVEQVADGLADPEQLHRQHGDAEAELFERSLELQRTGVDLLKASKRLAAEYAATRAAMPGGAWEAACSALADAARAGKRADMWAWQAEMLRDIFGNPFRPVKLEPAWRTVNVIDLARGIYGDRAFERMPILADALEDAGCTNAAILEHCRSGPSHVRGCWAVDLLLEKR
jgi:hypothetical protein